MFFNSFEYAIFLPVVVLVYWALRRFERLRLAWLIVASYYFYICWNWKFAGLIVFSTLLDFCAGQQIDRSNSPRVRRLWLLASLTGNLGCLALFKYYNFFIDSIEPCFGMMGIHLPQMHWQILLPVGISFYTFQTLSYTIDIYRGQLRPTNSLMKFSLFVAFFPQLVAGPIVRAKEFLPQLDRKPHYDENTALRGFGQILSGLFKKICIADTLAYALVDTAFETPESFSGITLLLVIYAYAMQIYCDFSGYSDIAIGSARLMGFNLPKNFDRPYLATSITDFWHRWHISLSTWLKDYLYIPLGGNRLGKLLTYRNLMITMLLGGLWHGAAWHFVLWGGIHGLALSFEKAVLGGRRLLQTDRLSQTALLMRRFVTFHVVCLAWLVFRAETMECVGTFLQRIVTMADGMDGTSLHFLVILVIGYTLHFSPIRLKDALSERFAQSGSLSIATMTTLALVLFTAMSVGGSAFIYFQF